AADNGEGTRDPRPYLNEYANDKYPNTNNDDAVYANKASESEYFFTENNKQNFCFLGKGNTCLNCETSSDNPTKCLILNATMSDTGYLVPGGCSSGGYIAGGKNIILKRDDVKDNIKDRFFRYWDEKAESKGYTGAYSAAFPKICYNGFTNTEKGMEPLINTIKNGYISYSDQHSLSVKFESVSNPANKANGVYLVNKTVSSLPVVAFTTNGDCVDPVVNSTNVAQNCYKDGKDIGLLGYYNYATESCVGQIQPCTTCGANTIMSFYRDAANKEPFRQSYYAKAKLADGKYGNVIEVPLQSCYVCSGVDSGVNGNDCATIIKEVFDSKKSCDETVRVLVTNLSLSGVPRFANYKTGVPCNCLTKIEQTLKGLGCS
ncbi:MAG: hypothetical protein K2M23_02980, partial [Alphaproteobacteria bacterium]|nr:hypothetical protein [Alphaproteobacteria bacterium]